MTTSTNKKLGFIGLGLMGGGMVRRLLKNGMPVNVFDIDVNKINSLVELGAKGFSSLKYLARESEFIFSSLPNPAIIKNVYLGENGILTEDLSKKIIVDMSTVDPKTTQEVSVVAGKKNVFYLDAPVSGGPNEAENGKLIIMVGGDQIAFESCKDIFDILGSTVHYVGESGTGNVVKLINNVMSMGNVAIAAEAFVLGLKSGVDGEKLFSILRTSGGRSHHFEKRFPNVLKRNFEAGFTVDLARKDLRLALTMADDFQVPAIATSLVHQLYQTVASIGLGKKDMIAIVELFEDLAGIKKPNK